MEISERIKMFRRDYGESFLYQLLNRMQSDCEYFLGFGNRLEKYLWAGNVSGQIAYMKALWESFDENAKPEWLSWQQILKYETAMVEQYC